jgi:hypothetical protein
MLLCYSQSWVHAVTFCSSVTVSAHAWTLPPSHWLHFCSRRVQSTLLSVFQRTLKHVMLRDRSKCGRCQERAPSRPRVNLGIHFLPYVVACTDFRSLQSRCLCSRLPLRVTACFFVQVVTEMCSFCRADFKNTNLSQGNILCWSRRNCTDSRTITVNVWGSVTS